MSSVSTIQKKAIEMVGTLGRAALATLYPNDFEIYLCSLELTDSQGRTIDFFTFPIMPDSIRKSELKRSTVRNTAGGITTLTSPIYSPSEINIRGNFGKNFKILLSENESVSGVAFSIRNGMYDLYQIGSKNSSNLKTPDFDISVKTGFGASRILKAIISKSNGVDNDGKPFRLYFYNMAFGENYLVTIPPSGAEFSMNIQKNMIWEYNINMTVIAPLEAVKNSPGSSSMVKKLASSTIQKSVNDLASYVAGIL